MTNALGHAAYLEKNHDIRAYSTSVRLLAGKVFAGTLYNKLRHSEVLAGPKALQYLQECTRLSMVPASFGVEALSFLFLTCSGV